MSDSVYDAFRKVRFLCDEEEVPDHFFIVTAYNPDGKTVSDEANATRPMPRSSRRTCISIPERDGRMGAIRVRRSFEASPMSLFSSTRFPIRREKS
jgi:hypothetical protein